MIDNLLTTGQSSRMYKDLVDGQQLATSVGSGMGAQLDPSLFAFRSPAPQGRPDRQARGRPSTPTSPELDHRGPRPGRAPEGQEPGHRRPLPQPPLHRQPRPGDRLSRKCIFGDYHKLATVEQSIDAVTAADIQRVLKQYFQPTNRTVAILVPTSRAAADRCANPDKPDANSRC